MREVKYRVWNSYLKEWVQDSVEIMLAPSGEVYYLNQDEGVYEQSSDYEINLSSGLKDTNGVEIYVGDIVEDREISKVYTIKNLYRAYKLFENYFGYENLRHIKIIDNIYEGEEWTSD